MFNKIIASLFAAPLTAIASPNPVVNGTYINGTHNRVHLSHFKYEGVQNYQLFLANPNGQSSLVVSSKAKPIQDNQTIIFTVPENPYTDSQPNLGCRINVKFSPQEMDIQSLERCTKAEKGFDGSYAYSEKSSVVPEKYRGVWGECEYAKAERQSVFLDSSAGSPNGVQRFEVLNWTESAANELTVTGVFYYESDPTMHTIQYQYLKNGNIQVKSDWDDDFSVYKICRD